MASLTAFTEVTRDQAIASLGYLPRRSPATTRPKGVGNTLAYPAAEEGPNRWLYCGGGASRVLCPRSEDRPAGRRWPRQLHARRRPPWRERWLEFGGYPGWHVMIADETSLPA
jgi:hypothetical protein